MRANYLYSILLLVALSSCNTINQTPEEELYSYLDGTFTSERQSEEDSSYYDVTLNFTPIWKEKEGLWVYAEQALSDAIQRPYTQKIYKISRGEEGRTIMKPYEIKEPKDFHGGWLDPSIFESLSPEAISPLPGCIIYFNKEENKFVGKTEGKNCESTTTGSKYLTSHFTVFPDKLISWSRGYSSDDTLVWGKTEGGYVLEKVQ